MKRLKKYAIPVMVCLLLLQMAFIIGVQGAEKVYAENESVYQSEPMPTFTPTHSIPPMTAIPVIAPGSALTLPPASPVATPKPPINSPIVPPMVTTPPSTTPVAGVPPIELTMPPAKATATATPTIPLAVIVKGQILTEINCSQKARNSINTGFTVKGGFTTETDTYGSFYMSTPYYPNIIDITIEKPGYLKRTLKGIDINRQTTVLNNVLMWAGDMNGDGAINMKDVVYVAGSFNTTKGDAAYNAIADIDKNNAINMIDITFVARHFNTTSLDYPEYVQESPSPTVTPSPKVTPSPTASPSSTVSPSPKPTPDPGIEIERKFLIETSKIPYNLSLLDIYEIKQSYISFSPEIRLRDIKEYGYILTVKAAVDYRGMIREEREFMLTEEEYNDLFKKREGNIIEKTRYQGVDNNGVMFAIDIFEGYLKGLAYWEVEFDSEEEANSYVPPAWVGKDVTSDKRYKNGSLARNGLPADFTPAP